MASAIQQSNQLAPTPHPDDDLLPEPASYPIEPLVVQVEWMRFCETSGAEQRFIADRVCISGLIGRCTHCGDERIAPFTRVNSEVA
jgi:hypothetical protein